LITGGHVLDPVSGIDGRTDIGITGGRIAAVAPNLDPTRAARVLEIRGDDRYVVPGLIDIHTHVAHGATTAGVGMGCCDPDEIGVRSGVTTVVTAARWAWPTSGCSRCTCCRGPAPAWRSTSTRAATRTPCPGGPTSRGSTTSTNAPSPPASSTTPAW